MPKRSILASFWKLVENATWILRLFWVNFRHCVNTFSILRNLICVSAHCISGGLAIADYEVFACGWLKATCPEWWSRLAKAHEDSWGSTSKVWAWLNSHVPHNYRLLPCIWPCPRAKTSPLFAEWPRTQSVPSPGTSMDRKYIQVITRILTW